MFQAGYARSMDNNAVILQTKEATLTAGKLFHQDTTYTVNTMKAASLKKATTKAPTNSKSNSKTAQPKNSTSNPQSRSKK
jgi:hypothetical protein